MPERLHNALKRSPIADGVKRAIGQHRQGEGGLERWGETLTPIVNPWGLPEWCALRGEQLAATRLFQGATAAEFAIIALINPAGSGLVVVVEAVSFIASAASQALLEVVSEATLAATLGAAVAPAASRDRRFKGPAGTVGARVRVGSDPANTLGAQLEVQGQNAAAGGVATPFQTALPVILAPGDGLAIIQQTVNLTLNTSWAWRERKAFPGELA